MMRGIDRVDVQRLFPRVDVAVTRENNYKVCGRRYRRDVRGRFFTQSGRGVEWTACCDSGVGHFRNFQAVIG